MNLHDRISKMAEAWYSNARIGKWKQLYFKWLKRRYGFHEWHITPINFRPYAIGIVRYINRQPKNKVVEIGCGLGEIIGNLRGCEKEGLDLDAGVIKAASRLYHNTHFRVGSFESIVNEKIDYLITVNFIHGISPEELKKDYKYLCENNEIQNIVLDVVDSQEYQYEHDVDYLFKDTGYIVKKRLHRYPVQKGCRWIYVLKKDK